MLPLNAKYLQLWLIAFALTQAIELPIYAWALTKEFGHRGKAVLLGFGASAITHPIVWFAFPWHSWERTYTYAAAETFAVLVEAGFLAVIGFRWWQALGWSLAANATSVAVSELLRYFFGWP